MSAATSTMLRTQFVTEQRIFWRNRSGMFFTFVLPLALLLTLGLSNDPVEYVPLVASLGILSTGFQGLAIQLSMHRDQGVLKRIMATPLPPTLLVAGKVLSTVVVIAIELAIVVTVGVLVFDAPSPDMPFALVVFVLLGTATFVALGFAVASVIPTGESAPAITNAAYLGLILVTALLAEVDGIPGPIRALGSVLPLEHLVVPIRHAWIEGWTTSDWASALVLLAWCTVAVAFTVRRFRWEPAGER